MTLVKLVEAIAKLVDKVMKLNLHFCELVLPKEYVEVYFCWCIYIDNFLTVVVIVMF